MSDPIYEEEALGKAYDTRLIRRLWRYVAPYRWQVLLTIAMVFPLFLLELAPGWIIKTGLDRLVPGAEPHEASLFDPVFEPPGGLSLVAWLAALYLLAMVTGALMQFLHMLLMATTGQSAMRDLRRDVFRHMQELHLGFFDRHPVGRLVTRATNDVENVAEMFSAGIVALITDLLKMLSRQIKRGDPPPGMRQFNTNDGDGGAPQYQVGFQLQLLIGNVDSGPPPDGALAVLLAALAVAPAFRWVLLALALMPMSQFLMASATAASGSRTPWTMSP